MSILPPQIHTYHCLCTSLLLASTHTLSSLPRRSTTTGSLDQAIILPLPSSPPRTSLSRSPFLVSNAEEEEIEDGDEANTALENIEVKDLPPEGYTLLLSMTPDRKPTIIRREDGFERRLFWRCGRCRLVVGYELQDGSERMNLDGGEGGERGMDLYDGKVVYLLPAGIMSTDVMMHGREMGQGHGQERKRVGEEDVEIRSGAVAVFE